MRRVRSAATFLALAIAAPLTAVCFVANAFATSEVGRRPVIIDSRGGIDDGQSGTVVRTGPLSWEPIVGARPIAAPTELAPPEPSTPMVVAPYIQLPAGGRVLHRTSPSAAPLQ